MQCIQVTGADLEGSGARSASFLSDAIDVSDARRRGVGATIQLEFSGSGTGNITVEGSLTGTEYVAITGATADPTDGSPIVFRNLSGFNFLKLRWTRTGNTLTFTSARAAGV